MTQPIKPVSDSEYRLPPADVRKGVRKNTEPPAGLAPRSTAPPAKVAADMIPGEIFRQGPLNERVPAIFAGLRKILNMQALLFAHTYTVVRGFSQWPIKSDRGGIVGGRFLDLSPLPAPSTTGSAPSHLGLTSQIRRSTEHQGVPLLTEVEVLWLP